MASTGEGNVIRDWAELLPDLLTMIAKRMHLYEDFVAFGGVCKSWRSIAVKDNFNHSESSRVQLPWLMLAEEEEECNENRSFVSLSKGGMVHQVELPEARGRHCIGSMGWLITTDEHGNTEMLHPLSRVRIPLPHATAYKYYKNERTNFTNTTVSDQLLIRRAVLSASPSVTDDYVLMVILGGHYCYAAFWRPGNNAWTLVEKPRQSVRLCHDVIFYKHQFYAISRTGFDRGNLLLCNPNSGAAQIVGHVPLDATLRGEDSYYLVESPTSGDLLLVSRDRLVYDTYNLDNYWTMSFIIYKFDSADMNKWERIKDLQGESIFVGHSAATAVPANSAAGIKPNCIYFTDDYVDGYPQALNLVGGYDMGIFNMVTQKIEPRIKVSTPLNRYCPPIWVFPSF